MAFKNKFECNNSKHDSINRKTYHLYLWCITKECHLFLLQFNSWQWVKSCRLKNTDKDKFNQIYKVCVYYWTLNTDFLSLFALCPHSHTYLMRAKSFSYIACYRSYGTSTTTAATRTTMMMILQLLIHLCAYLCCFVVIQFACITIFMCQSLYVWEFVDVCACML